MSNVTLVTTYLPASKLHTGALCALPLKLIELCKQFLRAILALVPKSEYAVQTMLEGLFALCCYS